MKAYEVRRGKSLASGQDPPKNRTDQKREGRRAEERKTILGGGLRSCAREGSQKNSEHSGRKKDPEKSGDGRVSQSIRLRNKTQLQGKEKWTEQAGRAKVQYPRKNTSQTRETAGDRE